MSNDKYKQVGTFVKKDQVAKMSVIWEGRPSQIPYLLFKANLIIYIVLAVLAMCLIEDQLLRCACYVGLCVCIIYAFVKTNAIRYYAMKEGLVFKSLFMRYYIPWHEIDWNKSVKAVWQFGRRSYVFAGEYQVQHSKTGYLEYATMWYLKNYEDMTSAVLSYKHGREFDYEQKQK